MIFHHCFFCFFILFFLLMIRRPRRSTLDRSSAASDVYKRQEDCDARVEPRKVLMCTPNYYTIVDVKNVHMQNQKGNVNPEKANIQWDNLRNTYLGFKTQKYLDEVHVIDGVEGLEDMVFCANQSFPWVMWNGEKIALMSRMRHELSLIHISEPTRPY